MIDYLLDTNACVALLNGTPERVAARFEEVARRGASFGVPSIVTFELYVGAAKSRRRELNEARLRSFLAGPLEVIAFTDDDAALAGAVRAGLAAQGTPIGAYDTLIAGQARRLGCVLVTANAREFERVPELRLEDWSVAAGHRRATGRAAAARPSPKRR